MSVQGEMTWKVNGQDPTKDTQRYTIIDGGNDLSTLFVNSATEKDNGESHIINLCPINDNLHN